MVKPRATFPAIRAPLRQIVTATMMKTTTIMIGMITNIVPNIPKKLGKISQGLNCTYDSPQIEESYILSKTDTLYLL